MEPATTDWSMGIILKAYSKWNTCDYRYVYCIQYTVYNITVYTHNICLHTNCSKTCLVHFRGGFGENFGVAAKLHRASASNCLCSSYAVSCSSYAQAPAWVNKNDQVCQLRTSKHSEQRDSGYPIWTIQKNHSLLSSFEHLGTGR